MHTQNQKNTEIKLMGMSSEMDSCIRNCWECYQVCSQLLSYCLEKGGKHADPQLIKLLGECAKICNVSADFMLHKSDYHSSICEVCAEICNACAVSCEAIADDEMMKKCVDACRKCAGSCEKMGQSKH